MNNIKPASGGFACGLLLVSPNMLSATLFCMIITSGSIVIVFTGPKSFWKYIRRTQSCYPLQDFVLENKLIIIACAHYLLRCFHLFHRIFNGKYLTYLNCNRHSEIAFSVVGGVQLIFLVRHWMEMFQHTSFTAAEIHIVFDMRTCRKEV